LEGHPVVNVTLDHAYQYCLWLGEVTKQNIRLPSEAEWEKAARGDRDQRRYAWGDRFEATRCNSLLLGLGETTPVGVFPDGASPFGCLDISGNVSEWTRSLWGRTMLGPVDYKVAVIVNAAFPHRLSPPEPPQFLSYSRHERYRYPCFYPYDPEDGREALEAFRTDPRVLRGGAFTSDNERDLRCARRGFQDPTTISKDVGFRVVMYRLI
jgi:formylglycine-generating enzyme required for sulfatase activity